MGHRSHDRRASRRYALSLPVVVGIPPRQAGLGKMRDISTQGLYLTVKTDEPLEPGTKLDFSLTLPIEATGGIEVKVRVGGKAVRIDRCAEAEINHSHVGIAAVIETYNLICSEPSGF
ncbi:MAG: PilZ domain-containing protein [Candidatus Acidiferrales bacterium]